MGSNSGMDETHFFLLEARPQTLTLKSAEPEARTWSTGWKSTSYTRSVWPESFCRTSYWPSPAPTSKRYTYGSIDPEARIRLDSNGMSLSEMVDGGSSPSPPRTFPVLLPAAPAISMKKKRKKHWKLASQFHVHVISLEVPDSEGKVELTYSLFRGKMHS